MEQTTRTKVEFMCKYDTNYVCTKPYKCWECEVKEALLKRNLQNSKTSTSKS